MRFSEIQVFAATPEERQTVNDTLRFDLYANAVLAGSSVGWLHAPAAMTNPGPSEFLLSHFSLLWLALIIVLVVTSARSAKHLTKRLRNVALVAAAAAIASVASATLIGNYRLTNEIDLLDMACGLSAVAANGILIWAYTRPWNTLYRLRGFSWSAWPAYGFAVATLAGLLAHIVR